MSQGNYLSVFPGFLLGVMIPAGFVDVTSNLDDCPKFECKLLDGTMLRLWVDYQDILQRENGDCRFTLQHFRTSDAKEEIIPELHTEDYAEVLRDILVAATPT